MTFLTLPVRTDNFPPIKMDEEFNTVLGLFDHFSPSQILTHVKLNPFGLPFYQYFLTRLMESDKNIISCKNHFIHTLSESIQISILTWMLIDYPKFDKFLLKSFLKVYKQDVISPFCTCLVLQLKNRVKPQNFDEYTVKSLQKGKSFYENKKRRIEEIHDLTQEDENPVKKSAILTPEDKEKIQILKNLLMEKLSQVPEETGILKNHDHLNLVYKDIKIYQIPDDNVPILTKYLITSETAYEPCCLFVKNLLYKKVKALKRGAARSMHLGIGLIAKTHPNALIDALFVPLCKKGKVSFSSFQLEVFNKMFEKDFDPNTIAYFLTVLSRNKNLEWNEFVITLIKTLVSKKIKYEPENIKELLKTIDEQASSFKSSSKFGNVIFVLMTWDSFDFVKGDPIITSICDKLDSTIRKSCLPNLK